MAWSPPTVTRISRSAGEYLRAFRSRYARSRRYQTGIRSTSLSPMVRSACRPTKGRITTVVANLIDNGNAFVAVRDFGVGIAPEQLSLLFQRFSRLPTEQNVTVPGTGLGLFLCQQIAQPHGGSIDVESTPGEGSEFTLRLQTAATSAKTLEGDRIADRSMVGDASRARA